MDLYMRDEDKPVLTSGGPDPCVHGMLLDERLSSLHGDIAEIRRRLERLETVLARSMAVLLANLTGIVLMLARQFLLK